VAVGLEVLVDVEEPHARLDDGVRALLVDLEDAVHARELDDHRARDARRGAAVGVVLAARDGPQRHAQLVRHPDDRLHLVDGGRRDHGTGGELGGVPEGVGIEELGGVLGGRADGVGAQEGLEAPDGVVCDERHATSMAVRRTRCIGGCHSLDAPHCGAPVW
jgi:hypothetical protein